MSLKKESLDSVLVPIGVGIMFVYHIWLLYRYLKKPNTTIMGFENHNKKAWVQRVMKVDYSSIALSVISSNISASTFLSSVSLTLISLIGTSILNNNNNNNIFQSESIYGNTSPSIMTIKYIGLLISFLLAFSCFIQSTRSFIHVTYLISMPNSNYPINYVENDVIRGGEFWQLGLRALYFALIMLVWFFGPIPMFLSSVFMAGLLHRFDSNSTMVHTFQDTLQ